MPARAAFTYAQDDILFLRAARASHRRPDIMTTSNEAGARPPALLAIASTSSRNICLIDYQHTAFAGQAAEERKYNNMSYGPPGHRPF